MPKLKIETLPATLPNAAGDMAGSLLGMRAFYALNIVGAGSSALELLLPRAKAAVERSWGAPVTPVLAASMVSPGQEHSFLLGSAHAREFLCAPCNGAASTFPLLCPQIGSMWAAAAAVSVAGLMAPVTWR